MSGIPLLAVALALLSLASAPLAARADDSPTTAILLAPAAAKSGQILPGGDRDWYKFTAVAGDDWTLKTTSPWPTDTVLRLYAVDGRTELAYDDDGGYGNASKITWRAPADGTYYAQVASYDARWGIGRYTITGTVVSATPPGPTGGAALTLDAPRVFDPKLADPSANGVAGHAALEVSLRVDAPAGTSGPASYVVDLDVRSAAGARVASILSGAPVTGGVSRLAVWSGDAPIGSNGASVPVDTGVYTLRLAARPPGSSASSAPLAILEREVRVARLGASRIALAPVAGGGAESAYLFHKSGGVRGRFRTILAADPEWQAQGAGGTSDPGDLDMRDGKPRPSPATWTDTAVPPSGNTFSIPAVFTVGSQVQAVVTLGDKPVSAARPGTTLNAGYPATGLAIRALLDGVPLTATGGGALPSGGVAPGGRYQGTLAGALPASIGRAERALRLTFEVQDGGQWRAIPGEQTARVRLYTILGQPTLAPPGRAATAPYLPWLAAVDLVVATIAPGAASEAVVAERAADHVFTAMGLSYDTVAGSPAYALGNLDDLELDLSGLLDRTAGRRVNCSDCATTSATLVNMVGGDVDYAILGYNFLLNYIKPIGGARFTDDPFGQGFQGGFSFHATASRDGGLTVHDACLSVDGDGAPASAPHTEARPRGMRYDDYRAALSPDFFQVQLVRRPKLR